MIRQVFAVFALFLFVQVGGAYAQEKTVPQSKVQINLSFAPVVKSAAPSVVNVYATKITQQRQSDFNDPFFNRFFGQNSPFTQRRPQKSQSLGSGVVVDKSGIILTNNHVVAGAQDIRISLADGQEFLTELVLADEETDLAVLKVKNPPQDGFVEVPFASDESLEVGDLVLAIGNPFGVGQTVTSGIVSALARTGVGVSDFQFFIQTDAAINPGNSGGALVNMRGELVGINTAIYSRSGGSNGIGFAIPASMARFIADAGIKGGEIIRPWLGARLQAVSNDLAAGLLLGPPRGALITDVYPGGPADQAGLVSGDVILEVNGRGIADPGAFEYRFSTQPVGEQVELYVARGGDALVIKLPLVALNDGVGGDQILLENAGRFSGAYVREIGPVEIEKYGFPYDFTGVIVKGLVDNSAAQRLGLREGDIILSLNGTVIERAKQLEKIVQRPVSGWRLRVRRGNQVINSFVSG
ncbi:Do family serine endopeptidase [Maritalea sp.]|jgi:serine protease Do|uniref:Do family serine endopeptidase n=1 Tax=Maritalea sp. TaxID=2003361 RepID=UPI0039E6A3A7